MAVSSKPQRSGAFDVDSFLFFDSGFLFLTLGASSFVIFKGCGFRSRCNPNFIDHDLTLIGLDSDLF
jgi:hypothetical protein